MFARLSRAERLFTRAQNLHFHRGAEASTEAFQQAHALSPTHPGISLHWALALADAYKYDQACSVLQHAIELHPSNAVLHLFMAQIHFDNEAHTQALNCLQRVLTYAPNNLYAHGLLALIRFAQGQVEEAYRDLTRPAAYEFGAIWKILHKAGILSPPAIDRLANIALQSRILLTIETYAWQNGLCLRSLSQQLIDQQIDLSTQLAHRSLAFVDAVLTHIFFGVKQVYLHVRHVHSKNARSAARYRLRADKAYFLCDSSTAISSYQKILHQRPDSQDVKLHLLELFYETGNFDDALAALKDLTQYGSSAHDPDLSQRLCLGELLYLNGQCEEAMQYLSAALESQITDFRHFYYTGLDAMKSGRKLQARQLFEQSLRLLNPGICRMRLDELERFRSHVPCEQHSKKLYDHAPRPTNEPDPSSRSTTLQSK